MLECSGKEIYLVCGATDMRKGLDGLAAMDITLQRAHHSAGHEFLFRSKRAHRNDGEPIH